MCHSPHIRANAEVRIDHHQKPLRAEGEFDPLLDNSQLRYETKAKRKWKSDHACNKSAIADALTFQQFIYIVSLLRIFKSASPSPRSHV